jgi:hypothetical protein
MEADGANKDVNIDGEEELEPASSLDTAGSAHSRRPPSPSPALPLLLIEFQG